MTDAVIKDIGRKCSDDVGAAIRRNMNLMTDQRGAFMVAAYGAATAIGSATGAFSALADDLPEPNEAMVDEMWRDFLRPLALAQLPNVLDDGDALAALPPHQGAGEPTLASSDATPLMEKGS